MRILGMGFPCKKQAFMYTSGGGVKASEGKGAGKGNQVSGIIFRQMPGAACGKDDVHFPLTPTLSLRAERSPVILRFAAITSCHENKIVTAMTGSG
jgi:hypothetical protein